MGNTSSYWLVAAVTLGTAAVGVGLVLLLSQGRTRTNIGSGVFAVMMGLATATTYPLVDEVNRTDPGWVPRLQGLTEVGGLAMTALYLSGLLATAQVTRGRRRSSAGQSALPTCWPRGT